VGEDGGKGDRSSRVFLGEKKTVHGGVERKRLLEGEGTSNDVLKKRKTPHKEAVREDRPGLEKMSMAKGMKKVPAGGRKETPNLREGCPPLATGPRGKESEASPITEGMWGAGRTIRTKMELKTVDFRAPREFRRGGGG